jgi:hypothetical protein
LQHVKQKKRDDKHKANTIKREYKDAQKGKTTSMSEFGDIRLEKADEEEKILEEMQKELNDKKNLIRSKYKKDEIVFETPRGE